MCIVPSEPSEPSVPSVLSVLSKWMMIATGPSKNVYSARSTVRLFVHSWVKKESSGKSLAGGGTRWAQGAKVEQVKSAGRKWAVEGGTAFDPVNARSSTSCWTRCPSRGTVSVTRRFWTWLEKGGLAVWLVC